MEEVGAALPDGAVLFVLVGTVDAVPDPVARQVVRDADGTPVLEERLGAGKVLGVFNSPLSDLNWRFGILICKLKCKLGLK